jgi:hypothetical protein
LRNIGRVSRYSAETLCSDRDNHGDEDVAVEELYAWRSEIPDAQELEQYECAGIERGPGADIGG